MENSKDTQEEVILELIGKIPENELNKALAFHEESANMKTYVRIPFLIIAVGFLIHNVFLAGKTYDIETYNNIQTIEMFIVGICVLVVLVFAIKAMNANSKIKKSLSEFSKKYTTNIKEKKELVNEFNILATHLYGARS